MSDANQIKSEANLVFTIAMLKSCRLFEFLIIGLSLLSIICIGFSHEFLLKVIAFSVFVIGMGALYFCFRARIDAELFKNWNKFNSEELDIVIGKINSRFKKGRTLDVRLHDTLVVVKKVIFLSTVQCVLTVCMMIIMITH